MIRNIKKSSLCFSFDGKFANMRKEQNFVIYPISSSDKYLKIQSDGRFGFISKEGKLVLTSKNENYPTSAGLVSEIARNTAKIDILSKEEMDSLRTILSGNTDSFFGNDIVQITGNEPEALKNW